MQMTKLPVVVFLDLQIEGPLLHYLSQILERTEVYSPNRSTPEAMAAAMRDAVALISLTQPVGKAELAAMPRLKLLSAWGVGYNHIDVAAATARGVPVCINPDFARSMAEATLTFILALAKRLPRRMQDARAGRRSPDSERGSEVRGKQVGVVGYGRMGSEMGELCHRLDMTVVAHDPYLASDRFPVWCQPVALDHLFKTSDFVVLVAPLTADTHHMISTPQLALMKRPAYLINMGRGPLVDEAALLAALQQGQIAGAGLDVWEEEPVRPDNPLLVLDNVIGTPHRLAATWESLASLCTGIQTNVFAVIAGRRPENVVNPEVFSSAPPSEVSGTAEVGHNNESAGSTQ